MFGRWWARIRRADHLGEEDGQALVVIAAMIAVLLGALAFALDQGYSLTQRRILQNEADAAVLAVGKGLATSVVVLNGSAAFGLHQEEAWCVASAYVVDANSSFRPSGVVPTFEVQFGDLATPTNWTTAAPASSCPATGALTTVPASTRYVRVVTALTFPTLFGEVLGQETMNASASARARLAGTAVPLTGPIWPMVRHYDPDDYDISVSCPPSACDPTAAPPITFWSSNTDDVVYGNFKGLVDLSRYSTRYSPALVDQLVTDWDRTGSLGAAPPTTPLADHSGNCVAGWDTAGGESPSNQNKQCSVPNWFWYTFRGEVSLSSSWAADLPANQEAPSVIGARVVICGASRPDPAPSCVDPNLGDWIETAYGNVGQNMSDNMRALIRSAGSLTPYSSQTVPNGPNKGNAYGRALTVLVYLWDCAESYSSSAATGQQWDLITTTGRPDCSQLEARGNTRTPDRVHLFTAAPFTFYEGLVTTQAIEGYWGGAFGDPRLGGTAELNALSNTAYLVPDD